MAKIGRNQPCPCGSGKKYKLCCLAADNAARSEALEKQAQEKQQLLDTLPPAGFEPADDELTRLSNRVVDLINDGQLDKAETACQALQQQYPDDIDWLMRTAMLHEARGEKQKAIDYYESTLAWMDDYPDRFESASRELFQHDIERLRQSLSESS